MTDRDERSDSTPERPDRRPRSGERSAAGGWPGGSSQGRRGTGGRPGRDGGRNASGRRAGGSRDRWSRTEDRSAAEPRGADRREGTSRGGDRSRGGRGPSPAEGSRDREFGRPRREGDGRGSRGPRSSSGADREPRERVHNPSDLRSANRPDRAKSPEIHEDVTGKELHRGTTRELESLDERNRPWVARHLVMAGRLLEIDPELAFEHALAASRRGGRLGCVREAVGITAYAAGEYAEALREFRTYRRITGDNTHLPLMVDSERALGRHRKALDLAADVDPASLEKIVRVELAMVISGIHQDLGEAKKAVAALEIPELNPHRGFSYSPRLFTAYADALEFAGRADEAERWRRRAAVAEEALGVGAFAEPEIIDFGVDEEADDRRGPRARDLVPPAGSRPADQPRSDTSASDQSADADQEASEQESPGASAGDDDASAQG